MWVDFVRLFVVTHLFIGLESDDGLAQLTGTDSRAISRAC
jgi:hypothetical protein